MSNIEKGAIMFSCRLFSRTCTLLLLGAAHALAAAQSSPFSTPKPGLDAEPQNAWKMLQPMPQPRLGAGLVAVNGKLYLLGGGLIKGTVVHTFNSLDEYDPATDTWTRRPDMPTSRANLGVVAIGTKLYVLGGTPSDSRQGLAVVEEYDTVAQRWSRKADMPTPRSMVGAAAVDGKIFVIGGNAGHEYAVEMYVPATDKWVKKANSPRHKRGAAVVAVGKKIYAIGGTTLDGREATSIADEYDPLTDRWTTLLDMPTARCDLAAAVIGDRIYVVGGWNQGPLRTVETYFPAAKSWQSMPDMLEPTQFLSAAGSGKRLYVAGGAVRLPEAVDYLQSFTVSVRAVPRGSTAR